MRAAGLILAFLLLQFSSGVNLVEVYVSVTDERGQPVRDLSQADFDVFEDSQPQALSTFAAGEFPLSIAVALDRSWSMEGEPLALARWAAHTFLVGLRPTDRSLVIGISNEVTILAPFDAGHDAQHRALEKLEPYGTTALHDAVIEAINQVQPQKGRRALLVLSDGDDRYSKSSAADVLALARRADVMVYPIALGRKRPELFAQLAVLTGGRSFHVTDPKKLEPTFTAIAQELRHQYLIGYSPARPIGPGQSEWRSIQVKVKRPGLRVRSRDGYQAQ